MEETVYGDVLLLIDFSIDFLALYCAAEICAKKTATLRLVAAAAIGALFSLIILFLYPGIIEKCILIALISVIMCLTAYGKHGVIKMATVLFLCDFAIGGGVSVLLSLFQSFGYDYDLLIYGTPATVRSRVPTGYLLLFSAISAGISMLFAKITKRRALQREVKVCIKIGDKSSIFNGLRDSGNLLCEPISRIPCAVVKLYSMKNMLSGELYTYILSSCRGKVPKGAESIRVIPINTVGNSGVIYAVMPDKIEIDGEEKSAYIALDTNEGNYGGNEMLIPDSLL